MDILLTTPINKTHYCVPSLGLGYLVSALRKSGFYSVSMMVPDGGHLDYKRFTEILKQDNPRVLGIQCFSLDVSVINEMLKIAKGINPNVITIIGGPHPTAVPENVFYEFRNLDFAIKGEAEISLPLLLKMILRDNGSSFGNIPGLIYREGNKTLINPSEVIKDLDSLDIVAWDLMDPRRYSEQVQGAFYRDLPVAPIVTSRGCPYECTFCSNKISMGRTLRLRSIEKVIEEIESLKHDYQVREIQILDDNFTINKKRVLRFCGEMKSKDLKMHIAFPNGVRLDTLDEDILSALKDAGAYSITVGIESGSQRILNHMKKSLTLSLIKEKVSLIKKYGFEINAFFIIGYPEETKEDIEKTIKFARELPIGVAHFSCFLPLPGTEITQELLKNRILKHIDYNELFYSKVPFSPKNISKKELKRLQRKAFLSFFLRARILIGLMSRLKSYRHLISILKRAKDYILSKG